MQLPKSFNTPLMIDIEDGPIKIYLDKLESALEDQHRKIYNDLKNQKFGNVQAGNYTQFSSTGDQTFNGSAGFYPRVLVQDGEPAAGTGSTQIDSGEQIVWVDSNDADRTYIMYNYGGTVVKAELT